MRTTDIPAASDPNLDAYLRVHRLLRISASQFADVTESAAADASSSAPSPTKRSRRDRAIIRWYRGFAGEIRCHHHIEDTLLFPALRDRVATYGAHGPRLEADHASLDLILDGLADALDMGKREIAARLSAELRDHLDEHLGFEDDEIVPLFIRHFTAIEFDELDAKAVAMTSPKQLLFTAPWMMAMLDNSERAQLLAAVPKAMTVLWVLTRGRYARMTKRVFGSDMIAVAR